MGMLELVCGPMFAGKTTELVRRYDRSMRAGRTTLFLRPIMDTRESITHGGVVVHCQHVRDYLQVLDLIGYLSDPADPEPMRHLIVDEAQFLSMDDPMAFIDPLQDYLAQRDLLVTLGGLDTDQAGRPFATTAMLAAVSEGVTKLTAVCDCGANATRSSWASSLAFGPETRIGGADKYKPTCRDCFRPVNDPRDVVELGVGDAIKSRKPFANTL